MTIQHSDGSTEFRFYRRDARRVSLVGDFNGWNVGSTLMQSNGDGWWVYRLRLEPDVYQFQYHADGRSFLDYAAFGLERGPLGWNSVVCVDGNGQTAVTSASRKDIGMRHSNLGVGHEPESGWKTAREAHSSQATMA